MRVLLILVPLLLATFVPAVGAGATPCQGGTANADGSCTYTGQFRTAGVIGAIGANTKQSGIDSAFFVSPGPGWFLVAQVDSVGVSALPADLDIHFYTAAGTHVDSKQATPSRPDHCDVVTANVPQPCIVPDFGASNSGLKFDVDGKITSPNVLYTFTVTAYPPGTCPAAYPDCGNLDKY